MNSERAVTTDGNQNFNTRTHSKTTHRQQNKKQHSLPCISHAGAPYKHQVSYHGEKRRTKTKVLNSPKLRKLTPETCLPHWEVLSLPRGGNEAGVDVVTVKIANSTHDLATCVGAEKQTLPPVERSVAAFTALAWKIVLRGMSLHGSSSNGFGSSEGDSVIWTSRSWSINKRHT